MPGSELFFGLPGYVSAGSLRFNAADNPNVVYKPLTTGNRKLWTWSAWIKRGKCSTVQYVFEVASADSNTNRIFFRFAATGEFRVAEASTVRLETTRAFRDPGAWYHFLVKVDTANSTPDNRCRIYVNGELETSFGTRNNFGDGDNTAVGQSTQHSIGFSHTDETVPFDGYMAEINYVDGIGLTPDYFGATDENGTWLPTLYGGSYGTNGFYLDFRGSDVIASATGGTITTDATNFKVHKFTSNGTYTLTADETGFAEVDILIVGGGGNAPGGSSSLGGGGGGGGGLYYRTGVALAAGTYSVVVGAASADSSFAGITALAGGDGGSQNAGQAGGSGGGGVGNAAAGATSNALLGFAGGIGLGTIGVSVCSGGGGGGAGGVGTNSTNNATGNTLSFTNGGPGLAIDIVADGTNVTYAAGGKGADHDSSTDGVDGAANTGNGASGGGGSGGGSGTGGTGIVVIRHKFQ